MSKEEEFVRNLLEKGYGYKVSRGDGYDFNAEKDDLKLAIEVKSTDISKPEGKIVIDWSQIEALMHAVKNGRRSYLFILTKKGEDLERDWAIFGLVECHGLLYLTDEEIDITQPSESPFVLAEPE